MAHGSSYASSHELLRCLEQSYTAGVLEQLRATARSQLHLGDCLEVLERLPDGSVDCIVTDPPYGINYLSRSHSLPLTRILNDGMEAYSLLDQALAIASRKLKQNS